MASWFNHKARLWVKGRKNIWQKIAEFSNESTSPVVWFHVSSLGEFEQGRPVIELLKQQHPEWKMVLTFFSPSGYEIRKNYSMADAVFYLPLDSRRHAQRFYKLIKPQLVVFVKYDLWYHFIHEASIQHIPIILISAVFKPTQIFFKRYGRLFRKMLSFFSQIFVQDNESATLLQSIHIPAMVAGDTRCDRVLQIAQQPMQLRIVKQFVQNSFTVVVGSAWMQDMNIIANVVLQTADKIKWIIVPHKIENENIRTIQQSIEVPSVLYSSLSHSETTISASVLIIDNIGMLSSLYQYAQLAYIGGGFGKGIHNILEPAVYGIPVIFGPHHYQFNEAIEMKEAGAVFAVANKMEFESIFYSLFTNEHLLKEAGSKAIQYIKEKSGATVEISSYIEKTLCRPYTDLLTR